ncbi:MAG: TldD/PmbA family protein [Elusimicrobia bacterium]|nr:TldD/PmbA family protein [Elusimicrobiota bacterium]
MRRLPDLRPEDYAAILGGTDYGEAFVEISQGLSVRLEDRRIEDMSSSSEFGMGLRFLKRAGQSVETWQGSVQSFDPQAAARLKRGLLGPRAPEGRAPTGVLSAYEHPIRVDPGGIPLESKISLLKSMDQALRSEFQNLRQVSLSYGERQRETAILSSEGFFRKEKRTAVILAVNVVAEKNGVLQTGTEILGALKGYELILDSNPLRLARQAARRALAKLDAPKAEAGEMPIVIASSAGGTFIHEAIGHSLEVDHVQEGSSPAYRGKVGQAIAPENISVVDDPTLPFQRGSFRFDDEGLEAKSTYLVKNGVLTDYLYDRVTAMKEGKPSNGHGRRESFHCRPIPRMSNLYIAPGKDDPREIVKSLKAGILVTRMGGGQVNTATGEFVFEVDEGFWVEDGIVKHMVRDANLLGIGPEILKSIDRVGWDIGWGIGTCGKDGQGVPVSDAQPTLRIPRILIGGQHG